MLYIVIMYHEEEGNIVFKGTLEECQEYVAFQESYRYDILPDVQEIIYPIGTY